MPNGLTNGIPQEKLEFLMKMKTAKEVTILQDMAETQILLSCVDQIFANCQENPELSLILEGVYEKLYGYSHVLEWFAKKDEMEETA